MNSAALIPERQSAIIQEVRPLNRQQISRYLNNAAMLVIVFGVAFAGAFMAMQINQPGGSDGNFALLGQTEESATCDVEPMTVDEALAIVEDPFGVNDSQPDWFREEQLRRGLGATDTPMVPHNIVDQALLESFQNPPDEDDFAIAIERLNGFLACTQNGTIGQALWFIRPFELQRIVLSDLPVYRDEAAVRSVLEELLPMHGSILVAHSESAFVDSDYVFSANTDIEQAASSTTTHSFRYGASEAIMIGITVSDQNGEVVFENDSRGRANPAGPLMTTDRFRVIMIESAIDEQWYVLAVIPE